MDCGELRDVCALAVRGLDAMAEGDYVMLEAVLAEIEVRIGALLEEAGS